MKLENALSLQGMTKVEVIQSLWSGYGEIARYRHSSDNRTLVVKHVVLPDSATHPRGWNTSTSHQRKVDSYHNEAAFYRDFSSICHAACRVPKCVEVVESGEIPLLVMEDLDAAGFDQRRTSATMPDVKRVIAWLAAFHGRFLCQQTPQLWPVGTYWHLATRQDEWQVLEAGPLKEYASAFDATLNQAPFQTLLHGDAKLANFCFSSDEVAAVDFQYTGRGPGVKDLAYFLGSCFGDEALFQYHDELLDYYFQQLRESASEHARDSDLASLEAQWRDLYCVAWADFFRFLAGWSPGHAKINPYMEHQTTLAIATIG